MSRNQFKEQFGQQFHKKATQYIADFEGMEFSPDNNLDNESLNKMKILLTDVLTLSSTTPSILLVIQLTLNCHQPVIL